MLNDLYKQIDEHEIISFDIFDTLVVRPFVDVFDVFSFLEKQFNLENYKTERLVAEQKAKLCNNKEININDIYNVMPYHMHFMKDIEIEFEKQILEPNKEIQEAYNYAINRNKKVILISDMYLTSNILSNILKTKGYDNWEKIYVSNEYNCRKSTGELYKSILEETKYSPKSILHIGDSEVDYKIPQQFGIKTYKVERIVEKFLCNKKNNRLLQIYNENKSSILVSYILSRLAIKNNNGIFFPSITDKLGYIIGGAVAYSYSKFIYETIKNKGITDICFIARDGFILKKIFDKFTENSNIKSHYVYAPRLIKILGDLNYGDNQDYLNTIIEYYSNKNPVFQNLFKNEALTNEEKSQLFGNKKYLIQTEAEEYKKRFIEYFKSIIFNGNKIVIVDLGTSNFSSQKILQDIIGKNLQFGIYLATGLKSNLKYESYLYSNCKKFKFEALLELLISEPQLPIIDFYDKKPVYGIETTEKNQNIKIKNILSKQELNCSIDILNTFKNSKYDFLPNIRPIELIEFFNSYINMLSEEDIHLLKKMYWFTNPLNSKFVCYYDIYKNITKRNSFIKKIFKRK